MTTGPTRVRISRAALAHNLARVRAVAPDSRIVAVIKANAYGHGLVPVARALARTDAYAVARSEEALALREAGLAHPVLLLEGPLESAELDYAARHHLDLVIHCGEQLRMLELYRGPGRFNLWLKFETGMNRLGLALEDAPAVMRRLQPLSCVARPLRLMTHLACADEPDNPMTSRQLARFGSTFTGLAGDHSLANSAAILAWPRSLAAPVVPGHEGRLCNWVRPGIMLYGVSPFPGGTGADHDLRPVMEFQTRLISLHRVRSGETVGYGATWEATRDTVIGVAAAGYGDGYPWMAAGGASVLVNGRRCEVVGRVSMDMMALDLGPGARARVGDPVILWGRDLPVETVARQAGTIPYELLCGITRRVTTEIVG